MGVRLELVHSSAQGYHLLLCNLQLTEFIILHDITGHALHVTESVVQVNLDQPLHGQYSGSIVILPSVYTSPVVASHNTSFSHHKSLPTCCALSFSSFHPNTTYMKACCFLYMQEPQGGKLYALTQTTASMLAGEGGPRSHQQTKQIVGSLCRKVHC